MYDHSAYTQIAIKKTFTFFVLLHKNDKFIVNELKLIAKSKNVKDYKNKSENDLIKILS